MKPNLEPAEKDAEFGVNCAAGPTQRTGGTGAPAKAGVPKRYRRLKCNELVSHGDFVADEHRGFEPWEGPNGFRANSFIKPVYRYYASRSTITKKLE
ncbi:MAG TPA: hypothetical protein VKA67_04770 [Verrucomicrobiae bacterium]|nr:hypothetical protein [Verrucomicrobiae bacterium]